MHDDTASVSDCFADATKGDGDAVEVCSLFEPETKLSDGENSEDGYEECARSEIWLVTIDGVFNRASWANISAVLGNYVLLHLECWG